MAGSDAWAMLEIDMEVSINVGTQNRWLYIYKENPTKMDDLLGIPPFQEASKWKLHVGDI
jgi:hypothetical protein